MLFGTMSECFRKIVRIVFELRALVWGWGREWLGCGHLGSFFFLVLIYRYPFMRGVF